MRVSANLSGVLEICREEREGDSLEEQEVQSSGTAKKMEEERGFSRSMAETYKLYPLQVLLKCNKKTRFAVNYSGLVYCGSLTESKVGSGKLCISFKFWVLC